MKKLVLIISVIILAVAGFLYFKFVKVEKTAGCFETTGIIEATEVELSSKIPGRITWLCCKEGDAIKAGTLAIRLDDSEFKARVEQGKDALKGAFSSLAVNRANVENARLGVDAAIEDVKAAEAEVKRVNALTEEAGKNLERVKGLFKDGLISDREMDAAKAGYDANYAQLDSAVARKRAADAKQNISFANVKAAKAMVSSAAAKVEELRAALDLLKTQLKDTEITSPIDGVVVYKAFEVGEMVATASPVYTVHDLKNIWARVDVEETMVGMMKLGNKARIAAEGLPGKEFDGEIIEIGREGEFATQRDVTRGRSDIRTFRVKIGIEEPEGLLKSGMTVMVKIYCQ